MMSFNYDHYELPQCITSIHDFILANTSTNNSKIKILTGQYETNIRWLIQHKSYIFNSIIFVLKWSAYGFNSNFLVKIAANYGMIGILDNYEADELYSIIEKNHPLLRLKPACYDEIYEAAKSGYNIHEWIGSYEALEDATDIAKKLNIKIRIHIYLFDHYNNPKGFNITNCEQLQLILDSIDYKWIDLCGIMTHLGYLVGVKARERTVKFLNIVLPVINTFINSQRFAFTKKFIIHWASSSEFLNLYDMDFCQSLLGEVCMHLFDCNFMEFAIRLGSATYGLTEQINLISKGELNPILEWTATVNEVIVDTTSNNYIGYVNVGILNNYPPINVDKKFPFITLDNKLESRLKFYCMETKENFIKINFENCPITVGETVFLCGKCPTLFNLQDYYNLDDYNIAIKITNALDHEIIGSLT